MSDLFRALPKISERPTGAPRPPPQVLTNPREDDASSSDSSASTADSVDTLRPSESDFSNQSAASEVPWTTYFKQELYLESSYSSASNDRTATYHVYLTPPANADKGPLFICHHGAGASGMSFARFTTAITRLMPEAGILSLEAREHGSVVRSSDTGLEILDFSIDAMVNDALTMIELARERIGWQKVPPSVLVGHSLGGAVATEIAARGSLGAQLVGFQVLDVVEGSAIEALSHMRTYLASRPPSFASIDAAVEWHVRSRTIRDAESAKASVPSLLLKGDDGRWKWKTDLRRTERWWEEWFTGMSAKFLEGRAAKGLVLAGTDRLDKELMVGQMQGE